MNLSVIGLQRKKENCCGAECVSKENNYLACSLKVKPEMFIPIFKNGRVVVKLDIDSHQLSAFKEKDKSFFEEISKPVANIFCM
ncbi:MAG TPA: hypothetical protein EYP23_01340 [Thermoplasmata archaeon]|nr:hypothetical protein [Thermoplasmata archaeon]